MNLKLEWDPKFHIITKTYEDFVRIFYTCPRGFVVEDMYDEFVGVMGILRVRKFLLIQILHF